MGRKKSRFGGLLRRAKGKNGGLFCVAAASAVGIGAMLVLMLMFAGVLSQIPAPLSVFRPAGLVIGALGSAASGLVCALLSREKGFFYGLACGAILFVILLVVSLLAWNQKLGSYTLVKFFTMLLAGAVGGCFGVNAR